MWRGEGEKLHQLRQNLSSGNERVIPEDYLGHRKGDHVPKEFLLLPLILIGPGNMW
jgi:hypothetical protein